ncbi:MAG: hypothetical protein RAK24_05055 [TACK group archaeon]|nr:hypothetical protein [TACK group archaeon]
MTADRDEVLELRQNLDVLQEKIDQAVKTAEEAKRLREELHGKIKELSDAARSEREKRDAVNEEVKKIKAMKDTLLTEYEKRKEDLEKLEAGLTPPGNREKKMESELKRLEWEYQVGRMTPAKAKELEDRIIQLENELKVVRQYNEARSKVEKAKAELREVQNELRTYKDKLQELANEAHAHHRKMLEALDQARALKAQADEAHMKFLTANTEATNARAQKIAIMKRLKELSADRNLRSQIAYYQKAKERMQELSEKAKEKVSKGKRLSFEEFQAYLGGQGPEPSQQTEKPQQRSTSPFALLLGGLLIDWCATKKLAQCFSDRFYRSCF